MTRKTPSRPRHRPVPATGARWTRPALLAGTALALLMGAAGLRTLVLDHPHTAVGGPYALTDDRGRPVTQADFHGRYTLIYFGYTHCIDVCPLTLATVATALAQLGPRADGVVPLFITVDPTRDSPKVVADYVARFSPRIVGLTGSPAQIRPVLDAFHVMARRRAETDAPADAYLMDHSSVLYLMDGNNRLAAILPVDSSPGMIADRLRALLPRS